MGQGLLLEIVWHYVGIIIKNKIEGILLEYGSHNIHVDLPCVFNFLQLE